MPRPESESPLLAAAHSALFATLLAVVAAGSAKAVEVDLFGDAAEGTELNRMGPDEAPARLLKLSTADFDAILATSEPATTRLRMPDGEEVTLILAERGGVSSIAPGAVLHEVTAKGIVESPLVQPDVLVGKVDGELNSLVVLTRVGPHVFGRIETSSASYEVLPADTTITATAPAPFVATILAPSNRAPEGAAGCGLEAHPEFKRGLPPPPEPLFTENLFSENHRQGGVIERMAVDRSISVGIDTTYETWQRAGNSTLLQYYIVAMMTQVDVIYRRDLEAALVVNGIRVWTTNTDPYSAWSSSSSYLDAFSPLMSNAATPTFIRNARIAHLLHSDGSDNLGGVAWLDTLCSTSSGGFYRTGFSNIDLDYSYPTSSYTWDVSVVAHEMGHSVGSPHTHCYSPPIDQCYVEKDEDGVPIPGCFNGTRVSSPGTIMSYCHLINGGTVQLLFSTREKNLMRAEILAASCISASTPPPTATATPNVTPTPTPTPPANDNFANAVAITTTANGTNVGATKQSGEPTHVYSAESGSVWYNWTAPRNGTTRLHTCGSPLDTVLAVYTGSAVNALTKRASNDDSTSQCNGTYQSEVSFSATSGTIYRVAVAGYPGRTGSFTLTVVPPPTPTPTPSPTPTPTIPNGDADGNGTVNVGDLTLLHNRIAGFVAAVPGDGDLDNDGDIDLTDANLLRAMLVP